MFTTEVHANLGKSQGMAVLRLLTLVAVLVSLSEAQLDRAFQDEANFESIDKKDGKIVQTRAIEAVDDGAQLSDGKFRLYVGTIDGVRREIFNEVEGEGMNEPDNIPNPADPWGAYDDNKIIETEDEKNLFVPKPYRPGAKTSTTTTTTPSPTFTAPPTTIRTIPFVQTTPSFREPISPVQPTFGRQPIPQTPPRVNNFVPTAAPQRPPVQTFTPAPIQPQPQFPQQPQQPHTLPPQPPQPQTFRPRTRRPPFRPPTQAPFQQPQQPFHPQQPFVPQQPQQTQRPFNAQPQFHTQAPFQPQQQPFQTQQPFQPQPTTPAPQLPFATQQNLRTGVCPMSIFYISTPISGPTRLSFTHFAIAVTVDQCARTCHEFNCAIAHYNPTNGHCEFNPSTAFAIRNGQCPAWPSLHYRNNVVASEPVRIFCVTCQRPRRRQNRQRTGFRQRAQDARHGTGVKRGTSRSIRKSRIPPISNSNTPVIHGVLVRQPKAIALGVSQFSLGPSAEPKQREIVGVSPIQFEDGGDSAPVEPQRSSGKSKVYGTSTSHRRVSSHELRSHLLDRQ
ncbi:hypothetical protein Y032_0341g3011 [Ancylostoma ceylanicum]|uniref:Apple domain-containing protein n=1 Tax=Ancylostoma ceylanicum TaxID=53326 RepID=A0A016RXV3_9BILA|nr:hypothetical protein Y032_0341g3011 [Ancylostoma ceylanicum]